tara:strand:+ start:392 stop:688 length:297 start_codon:yes stop_codon:yes gene_type:complete
MINLINETPQKVISLIKALLDSNKSPFITVDNERVGVVKSIENNTLLVELEEQQFFLKYISVNLLELGEVEINSIFRQQNEMSVYSEESVINLMIDSL